MSTKPTAPDAPAPFAYSLPGLDLAADGADTTAWVIHVSPEKSVAQLAHLMGYLRCNGRENAKGWLELRPIDPSQPPPPEELVAFILYHGDAGAPRIRVRAEFGELGELTDLTVRTVQ